MTKTFELSINRIVELQNSSTEKIRRNEKNREVNRTLIEKHFWKSSENFPDIFHKNVVISNHIYPVLKIQQIEGKRRIPHMYL